MNPAFWQGKRVFLTGHTGFKGAWLSAWLTQLGAQVTGYSLSPNTTPSLFDLIGSQLAMTSVIADIRDEAALRNAMTQANPEIIIHMAAQPLVRESYRNPVETYDINVMGTVRLLDVARSLSGLKMLLVVTTDKVYQNLESEAGYQEGDALGGDDPYASSKACAELVTGAYRKSYFEALGVSVATARAGNVIGGGDWAQDRLIPDMVRAFTQNQPLVLRYPQAIRPWQHVLEPLSGYLALIEALFETPEDQPSAWNFGPSVQDMRTVGDVVAMAAQRWGQDVKVTEESTPQPHETGVLTLDSTQAQTFLNWTPAFPVSEALIWTVDWYKAWASGATGQALFDITTQQIHRYETLHTYTDQPLVTP